MYIRSCLEGGTTALPLVAIKDLSISASDSCNNFYLSRLSKLNVLHHSLVTLEGEQEFLDFYIALLPL